MDSTLIPPLSPAEPERGRPHPARALAVALVLLLAVPVAGATQETGNRNLRARGVGVELLGGATLPGEGLSAVTEPGLGAGIAVSVPASPHLNLRLDGEIDLPDRDVAAGPLINVYSGLASLEYVLQQLEPGRAPLRTALRLGGGVSVVEAAEMPSGAPAGATYSESYLTLAAGVRLAYPVTRTLSFYVSPGVRWFRMPEEDWSLLTAGLDVPAAENGWLVPLRAGMRIGL